MADPKKSTDFKLAKDAVAHIETIESLDELSAFVGDDDESNVYAACSTF